MDFYKSIEKNRIKMMFSWFENYCKNVQQPSNSSLIKAVNKGSFVSPEYKFNSDISCGKNFEILPDHKYSFTIPTNGTNCGNFRLKCRKHLKFEDVIKKLELEIGGQRFEVIYGESVNAKCKFMNLSDTNKYYKDTYVIYDIPLGSYTYHFPKYHEVKIHFETASEFTKENIEILYDTMNLEICKNYIFYATQYHGTEIVKNNEKIGTYFNHNIYGLYIKLSSDEYGPPIPLNSVVKNMFIILDEIEIKISNSLLKILEIEYGYGMIPFCDPSLNFVEKLKRSINYGRIDKPSVKFEFYQIFQFQSGVAKIFAFSFGGIHSDEMAMSLIYF